MLRTLRPSTSQEELYAAHEPDLRPVPDGNGGFNMFQFSEWSVCFKSGESYYELYIPAGFVSDGTSGGIVAHVLNIQQIGLECRATWTHDALYRCQGDLLRQPDWRLSELFKDHAQVSLKKFEKSECDDIMLWLLLDSQVSFERSHLMHFAVKEFGQSAWDSHTPK